MGIGWQHQPNNNPAILWLAHRHRCKKMTKEACHIIFHAAMFGGSHTNTKNRKGEVQNRYGSLCKALFIATEHKIPISSNPDYWGILMKHKYPLPIHKKSTLSGTPRSYFHVCRRYCSTSSWAGFEILTHSTFVVLKSQDSLQKSFHCHRNTLYWFCRVEFANKNQTLVFLYCPISKILSIFLSIALILNNCPTCLQSTHKL